MSILLSVTGFDASRWQDALLAAAPGETIVLRPASAADESIDYAVVWKQPPGVLSNLPNLRAVFSLGAGVDHILTDKTLPDVPILRIVAGDLTARMSEYVVWRVLDHHRRGMTYRAQQTARIWNERRQPASEIEVGILGLGELGRDAALKLKPSASASAAGAGPRRRSRASSASTARRASTRCSAAPTSSWCCCP